MTCTLLLEQETMQNGGAGLPPDPPTEQPKLSSPWHTSSLDRTRTAEAATDISDRWIRESGAEQALENPAGRPNDKAPNGNVPACPNYLAMVCRVSAQMVAGAIGGSSGALRGRRTARRSERNNGSATTTMMPRIAHDARGWIAT